MAILFVDENGKREYMGLINEEEKRKADQLQQYLSQRIPALEEELDKKYGRHSIEFKYNFGKELRYIIKKYDIKEQDKDYLWKQIKYLSATEISQRKDRSKDRTNYKYWFQLAEYDFNTVKKLNWSEWLNFLDSVNIRREERSLKWLIEKLEKNKVNREFFRTLIMAMNEAINKKDTSMYTYDELKIRYDLAWDASKFWIEHKPEKPTKKNKELSERQKTLYSQKNKHFTKMRRKYFQTFFNLIRNQEEKNISALCVEAFEMTYKRSISEN